VIAEAWDGLLDVTGSVSGLELDRRGRKEVGVLL
jgi:hypothetical protein